MSSKKKDLEIICNLQWKNKHNGGSPEFSSIIGVYDLPSTTLNWDTFKSYLLKNSGTSGDDVLVSYIDNDDKEFVIGDQTDFQYALYTFRKKARNNEIVFLKMDRISKPKGKPVDCQSQSCGLNDNTDEPPEWFKSYMAQFKTELKTEILTSIMNYLSSHKSQSHYQLLHHSLAKKIKTDHKWTRKHPLSSVHDNNANEKELVKSMKIEKKLEKLECKSKKLKEKKLSLLSKPVDVDKSCLVTELSKMNAAPFRCQQATIPHMIGGEVYLHTWEVINNGKLPWSSDTELWFTWGSAKLEPLNKTVPCPHLKPGEIGTISVLLDIPKKCGLYESYWYFHHKGHKFGHWLGCRLIVDEVNRVEPLASLAVNSYRSFSKSALSDEIPERVIVAAKESSLDTEIGVVGDRLESFKLGGVPKLSDMAAKEYEYRLMRDELVKQSKSPDLTVETKNSKWSYDLTNYEFDNVDGNNSGNEVSDSASESICKIDECSSRSSLSDIVVVDFVEQNDANETGHAYVVVDGMKVAIPKRYLRSDYLETAEDAPCPRHSQTIHTKTFDELDSDHMATSTPVDSGIINTLSENPQEQEEKQKDKPESPKDKKSDGRLFVFPQDFAGYEVIGQIPKEASKLEETEYLKNIMDGNNADPMLQDSACKNIEVPILPQFSIPEVPRASAPPVEVPSENQSMEHVDNYQQTPPEQRSNLLKSNSDALKTETCAGPAEDKSMDSVVNTAFSYASSAMSTANSVFSKIIPAAKQASLREKAKTGLVYPYWLHVTPEVQYERNLKILDDMGFKNWELNKTLYEKYNGDLMKVIADLI